MACGFWRVLELRAYFGVIARVCGSNTTPCNATQRLPLIALIKRFLATLPKSNVYYRKNANPASRSVKSLQVRGRYREIIDLDTF